MDKIEEALERIKNLHLDLRPEVVVSELVQQGIPRESICVNHEGAFKRSYRKEITNVEFREVDHGNDMIEISISRDGLYDLLPEGIFHQSIAGSNLSVSNMVSEHKRFKEEEYHARRFFQALENEFFHQRVNIELQEKTFFETINSQKDKILAAFWQIDDSLPAIYKQRLIELLPQCKWICGNPPLMEKSLSIILNEIVQLELKCTHSKLNASECEIENEMTLSLDSILGCEFQEQIPIYEFKIGPLANSSIDDYIDGNSLHKILQTFYNHFTPFEPEKITTFVVQDYETDTNKNLYLGLNSYL